MLSPMQTNLVGATFEEISSSFQESETEETFPQYVAI